MRMIFKVSFYVRSNYENKSGKSPLMIRIYLNKEMLNVGSSGIYVDKKLWCNSTSRMKGRTQEALVVNAQLDEISTSFQEKNLTYHLARQTFAIMILSKGVPIESVSKMLGHTNARTTQVYALITNNKIEEDMLALTGKLDNFNDSINPKK